MAEEKQAVPCIIDSHMHIQSGACAPLPLVYNQLAPKIKFNPKGTPGLRSRSWIDGIGKVVLGDGGKLQTLDTTKIGNRSVADNIETYKDLKDSYKFAVVSHESFAPNDATSVHTPPLKDNNTYISETPSGKKEQIVVYAKKGEPLKLSTGKSYLIIKEAPDVFCPMIVMPMDMEYAHIAGYEG